MGKKQGLKLICRGCFGEYYQTTDKFRNDRPINASMFEMLPEFKENGWNEFPPDPLGIGGNGDLFCPNCETPYANPAGFARIDTVSERTAPLRGIQLQEHAKEMKKKTTVILDKTTVPKPEPLTVYVCVYCEAQLTSKDNCVLHIKTECPLAPREAQT